MTLDDVKREKFRVEHSRFPAKVRKSISYPTRPAATYYNTCAASTIIFKQQTQRGASQEPLECSVTSRGNWLAKLAEMSPAVAPQRERERIHCLQVLKTSNNTAGTHSL